MNVKVSISACLLITVSLLASGQSRFAFGHDQIPGEPQSRPIALVGGTIHRISSPAVKEGTVLFEDGKITSVGKSIKLPRGCRTIDVSGQHVYPSLMESMSELGLKEISSVRATVDTFEIGDANPNVRPWVAFNPDSELIPVARSGGVLLASIVPGRGSLRGQSAVMMLDGWNHNDMLLKANTGLMVSWRYYDSREDDADERTKQRNERLKSLEDRLDVAKRYAAARAVDPASQPTDVRLEALVPVVQGDVPMIVEADSQREIEAAVAFCISQKLKLVIYGGYDAPECANLLNKYDVPVIVHATYRLPRRRDDPYDHAYTLPARLHDAGIEFAIGGEGAGGPGGGSAARNLPYHAAVAVAYGLSHEKALHAITLGPAKIMGVDDQVGSLDSGKDATLIVTDGDILLTESNVIDAYVRGAQVDLGSKQKTLANKYRIKYARQKKTPPE